MKYPPLSARAGPPVTRVLIEITRAVAHAELRARLAELSEEPLGFVARAIGERHRELQQEGRTWTEADVEQFVHERLPVALEEARAHELEREGA